MIKKTEIEEMTYIVHNANHVYGVNDKMTVIHPADFLGLGTMHVTPGYAYG